MILLSLLVMSCGLESKNSTKILASSIIAPPEGGLCEIEYTIKNPINGQKIEASTEADWISYDFEYLPNNKIKFVVEPCSVVSRTANISLKYGSHDEITIQVSQYELSSNESFTISLQAVNAYGATLRYTANNHDHNYFFLVMSKHTVDQYLAEGGENSLYNADIDWIKSLAEHNKVGFEEFLPVAKQIYTLNGDATTMNYTTLSPGETYYAYCYGMDKKGNKMTEVVKKEFTTDILNPIDLNFEIQTSSISSNSAEVTVIPSSEDVLYTWSYVIEAEILKYGKEEIVKILTDTLKARTQKDNTSIGEHLHKGISKEHISGLWSNANYYIVAWATDRKGNIISEITSTKAIQTKEEVTYDDCTFEISCPEVKSMDILINVKPSNNATRYYVSCISDERTKGYNSDQMARRIINMESGRLERGSYGEGTTWEDVHILFSGEQSIWAQEDLYWTFTPDNLYHIYVFGIDEEGNRTTDVAHFTQRSAPSDKSDMTFDIDLIDQSWNYGIFNITPSNNEEYYLTHLIESGYLETFRLEDGSLDSKPLMDEISKFYDGSINYQLRKGEREKKHEWSSDTDFTLLAFAFAGTNTSEITEFKLKTSSIPFTSDANVDVSYEFFDGNDLYEMDPERWADARGEIVMHLTFAPNDKAVNWYSGVWQPVSNYERGVDHLMKLIMNPSHSFVKQKSGMIYPPMYTTSSLSYVAEAADGTFGPWNYIEFTPSTDKISEPYNFWSTIDENNIVKEFNDDAASDFKPRSSGNLFQISHFF